MASKSKRRESGWLSINALAACLDVTADHFRKDVIRHVPADCQRMRGGRREIYARNAIEAWLASRVAADGRCSECVEKDSVIDLLINYTPGEEA